MKVVLLYAKLTNLLSFQTRFKKVDQHTGGKWLIRGTKHHKDNQLQSLELPIVECPSKESKHDIKESESWLIKMQRIRKFYLCDETRFVITNDNI